MARPHLVDKILAGVGRPGNIVLVSGPAGFGKTTLMGEFVTQYVGAVAWLSLDEEENDPIRFWTYLIKALQTLKADLGESALALLELPQLPPADSIVAILINDLARLDTEVVLVLDDLHLVQNEDIHKDLSLLIDHIPEKFHLLVSTRIDPPWPLPRLRARNQLVEIRTSNLRFSSAEAAIFLKQLLGFELSEKDVEALEIRTEGWVAALQLAAVSMQGRADISGFIKSFTGSHLYIAEYLVEEVFKKQNEAMRKFLLETSILGRLNADLCEAVTGCENAQFMLQSLSRANLFIVSLDDEGNWYRYHHLFADLLRARLQREFSETAICELHRSASAWYELAGMMDEAIEHSLAAKEYPNIVRLVENIALSMILQAQVKTVERWLRAVPPENLEKSPRLNMAFSWLNLIRNEFAQAAPFLERLRKFFSTLDSEKTDPSLSGEWLALQAKLSSVQGKPEESRDLGNQALQILPEKDILMRSWVYVNLATAYEQMLDYDHAAATFQLVVRNARAMGDFTFETLGISGQGRMELLQGRLRQTFATSSEGISRVESTGRKTPFSATFYGELCHVYYHWFQLDLAREYSLRSVQASGKSGFSDPEIFNYVLLSKIFQIEGNWDDAAAEMKKANDLAGIIPPAMIRETVISQDVRVHLAFDRLSTAHNILKPEGFNFEGNFLYPNLNPGTNITHTVGVLYNSALRVLLYQVRKNPDQLITNRGIDLATLVLTGELQCGHIPVALETLLIRSQLFTALGDDRNAQADVEKALELAEPEGFISIFLEEGPPIESALIAILKMSPSVTALTDYVQKILAAFPAPAPAARIQGIQVPSNSFNPAISKSDSESLINPLTIRELEVLQLIAAGNSNQAIAEKLVITLSAVKKHTTNIFGKLNVNSRTQAVAHARQLGLLSVDE